MATENTERIVIPRRDDRTYGINCTDEDGDAISLTGYTLFCTVKRRKKDADADAVISKTIVSPTTLTFSKTDTDLPAGLYYYDIQLKDPSGNIETFGAEVFEITQDITVRTS